MTIQLPKMLNAVPLPVLLLLLSIIIYLILPSRRRLSLPVINRPPSFLFPHLRARIATTKDFKSAILLADTHHRNKPVILPILTGDMVLLPRSDTQWVVEQPDTILDMHSLVMETLQIDHTTPDPELVHRPIHHKLITTTLTNQVGNLVPDVAEETEWSVSKYWDTDSAEGEVCVYKSVFKMVGAVSNRVFIGAPLCRDETLLQLAGQYAQIVPMAAVMLRMCWGPVKTVLGAALRARIWIVAKKWERRLGPEIRARVKEFDESEKAKNDFLGWCIGQAKAMGEPALWSTSTLAGRVLLLNFAAIHTSSFGLTGAILDLAYGRPQDVDELREEIEAVLAENGGEWNKKALARMEKLDSVMRESARLNSFATVGLGRMVTAREGVVTPSGVKLPYGTNIAVPSYAVLHDDDKYPDANEFRPFRFSTQRQDESVEYIKRAAKSFATTSNDYLAFGHGRNACPGRFFAANELKLMLAHLVLNYDFEPLEKSRPKNMWFGLTRVPPMEAKIRIRRRVRA
ncbi:hypothetical protein OQA88_5555 [Cercophora sp. LCS_1]